MKILISLFIVVTTIFAKGNLVVVDSVIESEFSKLELFSGNIFFKDISNIASESSGKVIFTNLNEGARVKKGEILAKLDIELLENDLKTKNIELSLIDKELEKIIKDFERIEKLFKSKTIAEQNFDDIKFKKESLLIQKEIKKSEIEKLKIEINKKVIKAPFNGTIISKKAREGEWLNSGGVVAMVAKDEFEVVVNIPNSVSELLTLKERVKVLIEDKEIEGEFSATIPKADIQTRLIPIKISLQGNFKEGLEAKVALKSFEKIKALSIHRDGYVNGKLFVVRENIAKSYPITVVGFDKERLFFSSKDINISDKVVIKGNERLKDKDEVEVKTNNKN